MSDFLGCSELLSLLLIGSSGGVFCLGLSIPYYQDLTFLSMLLNAGESHIFTVWLVAASTISGSVLSSVQMGLSWPQSFLTHVP